MFKFIGKFVMWILFGWFYLAWMLVKAIKPA